MSRGQFSARLDESVLARLERRSRQLGRSKSSLAERLIDEGLRMREFPGIIFRDGPTGRRASLIDGPDVWEIVADLRQAREREGDALAMLARGTGLRREQIELAAAYYDAHRDEIDEEIRANEEMTERVLATLSKEPRSG